LWTEAGRGFWTERCRWSLARWRAHLRDDSVAFWIGTRAGKDIGFFEFCMKRAGVKLEGFGLLPAWRGRGLGGALLTAATQRAFATGARRIWLHTATDDHPHALPNYEARGYRVYRQGILRNPMPSQPVARRGRAALQRSAGPLTRGKRRRPSRRRLFRVNDKSAVAEATRHDCRVR
jgi:ribosomal protein S18 acetylase RimI-like enzyme